MLVLCTQLAVRCTSPSVAARWLPVPPALLVLTRLSVYFFISCVCAPPFPFLFMGLGQSLAALEELVLTVIWSTVGAVDAFLGWLLTPLVLAAHVVAVAWTWLNWAVARAWQPVARYGWHAVVLSVIVCTFFVEWGGVFSPREEHADGGRGHARGATASAMTWPFLCAAVCFSSGEVGGGVKRGAGRRRRRLPPLLAVPPPSASIPF